MADEKIISLGNLSLFKSKQDKANAKTFVEKTKLGEGFIVNEDGSVDIDASSTAVWTGTKTEYDSIDPKDENTLYAVTDEETVFDDDGIIHKHANKAVLDKFSELDGKVMYDGATIGGGGGGLTLLGRYANTNGVETTIGTLTDIPEGTKLLFMGTRTLNADTDFFWGLGFVPPIINGYVQATTCATLLYSSSDGHSYEESLTIYNKKGSVTFYGSSSLPSYLDIYKLEV